MVARAKMFTDAPADIYDTTDDAPMMGNSVLARTQRQKSTMGGKGWQMAIPFGVVAAVAVGVFAYTQMNKQPAQVADAVPTAPAADTAPVIGTPVAPPTFVRTAPDVVTPPAPPPRVVASVERPVMPASRAVHHRAAPVRATAPSDTENSANTSATAPTVVNPLPPPEITAPPPAPEPNLTPAPDPTPPPQ